MGGACYALVARNIKSSVTVRSQTRQGGAEGRAELADALPVWRSDELVRVLLLEDGGKDERRSLDPFDGVDVVSNDL